ncbi:MAG: hypothetical protein JSV92_02915 [archaeon]|nr:MAG: hypothetical protein JSV92_02915 [archaeon]
MPRKKRKGKGRKIGLGFIFLGVIILGLNIFLTLNEPGNDVGTLLGNSLGKPKFTENTNILIFASMASWIVPMILIFMGMIIAKRSTKKETDFI